MAPNSPSRPEHPPQLARFPQDVRDAFARFRASGDPAAAQAVVSAALLDFLPTAAARGAGVPGDDQRLIEDLGYDSLAIAEMVFFFEDLFQVKIETNDLRGLSTVGQLRAFVARQIGQARGGT